MTVNCSKKMDVWKFGFSNWMVDNWNCVSACCVTSNSGTVNAPILIIILNWHWSL